MIYIYEPIPAPLDLIFIEQIHYMLSQTFDFLPPLM
ncbi:hypothetical protein B597_022695 [Stutzerimonas stutzeri KOS6]|uniref:Uncharacterized protein n=1 Tax=Stutzerimonas stutzeri KOS6 TaxID=1218352 RepID=A0A061JLA7_STUST|nr:hypothetical protein B597_022695 [Stutzerimonas stutzeri KOS6]